MDFTSDFFEALRRMKARRTAPPLPSSTPPESAAIAPAAPLLPVSPTHPTPRSIGAAGLALIKRFEGCARLRPDGLYEAYPDPGTGAAPWTIGWGATGKGITRGAVWTRAECDARLASDLEKFATEVVRALGAAPTSQAQFDALVSFHYNTGAIFRATLTRLHKAGRFGEAEAEFAKWVHAGGKRLTGLVRRRAAEAALYRGA